MPNVFGRGLKSALERVHLYDEGKYYYEKRFTGVLHRSHSLLTWLIAVELKK
jgi:hypothetical protein